MTNPIPVTSTQPPPAFIDPAPTNFHDPHIKYPIDPIAIPVTDPRSAKTAKVGDQQPLTTAQQMKPFNLMNPSSRLYDDF